MTDLTLPKGIGGLSATPKQKELLVNLYWTARGIFRTPGLDLHTEAVTSGCRGAVVWYANGKPFFVIGETLYRLNGATLTVLGSIAGSSQCVLSPGQTSLVIIVKGGNGYTYDALNGLLQITDPDFVSCDSVDFIDGRHVFIPSDGSPAFYSDIDISGSINPLAFFDAEELPDRNRFCINISNNLYIGGSDSFEIFKTTGDQFAPFARRDGGRVDVGYVSAAIRYKNTFAFIGRRRDQGYIICAMSSGDIVELDNESISEILNNCTEDEILAAVVDSFEWNKSTFLAWTIANFTICFVDDQWIYLDSELNGDQFGSWRARCGVFVDGRYYFGDAISGKIGILSGSPSEYGEDVEYFLQSYARAARGSFASVKSLEIDCLTGLGAETIGLSVSRDGRVWSDFHYRDLGEIGEYQRRVMWNGGLGCYESFMGYRLRGTGQVKFSLENATIQL